MAPVPVPSNRDLNSATVVPASTIPVSFGESSPLDSDSSSSSASSGLSPGALAGIIVSVIAVALLVSALVFCLFQRRRRRRTRGERLLSTDDPAPTTSNLFRFIHPLWRSSNRLPIPTSIRGLIRHPSTGSRHAMSPSPLMPPQQMSENSTLGTSLDRGASHDRETGASFDAGAGIDAGIGSSSSWSSRRHSSTSAVPLTPPPRLKERRMLSLSLSSMTASGPSRGSHEWFEAESGDVKNKPNDRGAPGSPLGATAPMSSKKMFSTSPVWSPTSTKLYPRHEKMPRMYGLKAAGVGHSSSSLSTGKKKPSSFQFPFPLPDHTPPVPQNNLSSPPATPTAASATPLILSMPPLSPSRPPRPHEAPLEIPDLVTPTIHSPSPGPPPTRNLPAIPQPVAMAPAAPPTWPPPMPMARHGEQGTAYGFARRYPTPVNNLPPRPQNQGSLTSHYTRKPRDSWGSWSILDDDRSPGIALTTGDERGPAASGVGIDRHSRRQ
jgi:hypothetical protein